MKLLLVLLTLFTVPAFADTSYYCSAYREGYINGYCFGRAKTNKTCVAHVQACNEHSQIGDTDDLEGYMQGLVAGLNQNKLEKNRGRAKKPTATP